MRLAIMFWDHVNVLRILALMDVGISARISDSIGGKH